MKKKGLEASVEEISVIMNNDEYKELSDLIKQSVRPPLFIYL